MKCADFLIKPITLIFCEFSLDNNYVTKLLYLVKPNYSRLFNPYSTEISCINHGDQRLFQFEIILNISVGSFRFISIDMLWVYDFYKYFNSVFIRQNLTPTCPHAERVM